jgi:hypothetical protein
VRILRKTPLFELLTSAVVASLDVVIAPKPRIASDALFIEGVVFSVIGTIIALRISDQVTFPSLHKKQHETTRHEQAQSRSGLLTSILMRRNGLRILLIGFILVTAAIIIGELLARPAT